MITTGWCPVITCEHARATIPARLRPRLRSRALAAALRTHRGLDLGALPLARRLAQGLGVTCLEGRYSRLLVDLNRSHHHAKVFSEFSRSLDDADRLWLLQHAYWPHRQAVTAAVLAVDRALHIGVHSFTPVLHEAKRSTDVAVLYDPARPQEAAIARAWRGALRTALPGWRVHLNRPYRGTSDGLTTTLRSLFGDGRYAGLELEVNQARLSHAADRRAVYRAALQTLT